MALVASITSSETRQHDQGEKADALIGPATLINLGTRMSYGKRAAECDGRGTGNSLENAGFVVLLALFFVCDCFHLSELPCVYHECVCCEYKKRLQN